MEKEKIERMKELQRQLEPLKREYYWHIKNGKKTDWKIYKEILELMAETVSGIKGEKSVREFSIDTGLSESVITTVLKGNGISLQNFIKLCISTNKTQNELLNWEH